MAGTAERSILGGRHLLDVGGAILGDPVFEYVEIERALQDDAPRMEAASRDPSSTVGRCVRAILAEVSSLRPPNALITFVRDGRDYYVLTLGWADHDEGREVASAARLTIPEPLATARPRRLVVTARVERRGGGSDGAEYAVSVPVRPPDDPRHVPALEHLQLMDSVLGKLTPRETHEPEWSG